MTERIKYPSCKNCSHFIISWTSIEFSQCDVNLQYCSINRNESFYDDRFCGVIGKAFEQKIGWFERLLNYIKEH